MRMSGSAVKLSASDLFGSLSCTHLTALDLAIAKGLGEPSTGWIHRSSRFANAASITSAEVAIRLPRFVVVISRSLSGSSLKPRFENLSQEEVDEFRAKCEAAASKVC